MHELLDEIDSFEKVVRKAYQTEAERLKFTLHGDLPSGFLTRYSLLSSLPYGQLKSNLEKARGCLTGAIPDEVAKQKEERERQVELEIEGLRNKAVQACRKSAQIYGVNLPHNFEKERAETFVKECRIEGSLDQKEERMQQSLKKTLSYDAEIRELKVKELLPVALEAKIEAFGSREIDTEGYVRKVLLTQPQSSDWKTFFRTQYWKAAFEAENKPLEFGLNSLAPHTLEEYRDATYACRNYPILIKQRREIMQALHESPMLSERFIQNTLSNLNPKMRQALFQREFNYPFDPATTIQLEEKRVEQANLQARTESVACFRKFLYEGTEESRIGLFEELIASFEKEVEAVAVKQSQEAYQEELLDRLEKKKQSVDIHKVLGQERAQRREYNEKILRQWRSNAEEFLQARFKVYASELNRLEKLGEHALEQNAETFKHTISRLDHELKTLVSARLAYKESKRDYHYPELIEMLKPELQLFFDLPEDLQDAETYEKGTRARQNMATIMTLVDLFKSEFAKHDSLCVDAKKQALAAMKALIPVLSNNLTKWNSKEAQDYIEKSAKPWIKSDQVQMWIKSIISELEKPVRQANQEARKKALVDFHQFAVSIGWEGSRSVGKAVEVFSNALSKIGSLEKPAAIEGLLKERTGKTQEEALRKEILKEKDEIIRQQQEKLGELVEAHKQLAAKVAKDTFDSMMHMPYFKRFQSLLGNQLTASDSLARWVRMVSIQFASQNAQFDPQMSIEQQISRFNNLQKTLDSHELRESLAKRAREIIMEEAASLARQAGEMAAKDGPLSETIWNALPDRPTLDHYNNALQLMQLIRRWRVEITEFSQQNYRMKAAPKWVENAAQLILLQNLGDTQLAELISFSPDKFSGHLLKWGPIDENTELINLCQLSRLQLKQEEDVFRETAEVSAETVKKILQGELEKEIGNRQLVKSILASLTSGRTVKEMPTSRDIQRKALTIKELKLAAIQSANAYYLDELSKQLKVLDLIPETRKAFILDAIPRNVLLNHEPMSETMFNNCVEKAKALVEVNKRLDGMRSPQITKSQIGQFEHLLNLLPPAFQKELREEYYKIRCQVLAEMALGEIRVKLQTKKHLAFLSERTFACQSLLPMLGLKVEDLTLDTNNCIYYFGMLFQDERWTKKYRLNKWKS